MIPTPIELTIERLAHGGRGVGRHQGKAVFVSTTAPGDHVRCQIVLEKKRYAEAELLEVITPSSDRRQPPCPHFPECGGCQWQHLTYAAQLRSKQTIFSDALVRTAQVDSGLIRPILPAEDEWHYRCRAQIKCRLSADGFVTGFYRSGTHRVVPFASCPVLDDTLNTLLPRVREGLESFSRSDRVPQCDVCVDDNGQVVLIIHLIEGSLDALITALAPLAATGVTLYVQSGRKDTLQVLSEGHPQQIRPQDDGRLALEFPPGGFVQVNLAQNRRLVAAALDGCRLTGRERVLDLYCGIGNFSLPLARKARQVTGVEAFAPAIDAARRNAVSNRLDNLQFHAKPAERYVQTVPSGAFDVVLLDPPRAGAYAVAKDLVRLQPERIVYVSCDPATLARDLQPLLHGGYRLESAQPVDMFPQTSHIEGVAVLILQ
jgi:23S rRNA (uracil1939-C5)-methyltransferase